MNKTGDLMLLEIGKVYCQRCKKFVPIFDSINIDFSTTEVNCSECGNILVVLRSERQFSTSNETEITALERYIRKENKKSEENYRLRKALIGSKST